MEELPSKKSIEWFEEASKYLNTYYGQLAFTEINPGKAFSLLDQPAVSKDFEKKFRKHFFPKFYV